MRVDDMYKNIYKIHQVKSPRMGGNFKCPHEKKQPQKPPESIYKSRAVEAISNRRAKIKHTPHTIPPPPIKHLPLSFCTNHHATKSLLRMPRLQYPISNPAFPSYDPNPTHPNTARLPSIAAPKTIAGADGKSREPSQKARLENMSCFLAISEKKESKRRNQ